MKIWSRPWVPNLPNGIPRASFNPSAVDPILHPLDYSKVQQLMHPNSRNWNEDLLRRLFDEESFEAIIQLRPLPAPRNDSICWRETQSGVFDVKSAHTLICEERTGDQLASWSALWKLPIHERFKVLLWRMASDIMPVKIRLARVYPTPNISCPFCETESESIILLPL